MKIDEARSKMKNYTNSSVILPLLDEVEKLQAENEKLKNYIIKNFISNCPNSPDCVDDYDCWGCGDKLIQTILESEEK